MCNVVINNKKSQNKEEINHEYKFLSEPKTDNPVDNIDCI